MPLKLTPASQWRRARQGYPFTLPSGMVAQLRPIQFDIVAKSGKVPDFLSPIVERLIMGKEQLISPKEAAAMMGDMTVIKLMGAERQLKEMVAMAAFVYPVVTDNPTTDDEISPLDIPGEDLEFVWQITQMPAADLERFSLEQAAGLGPVDERKNVEEAPIVADAPESVDS